MENSNKIIPPHLNAEVYRSDTTGTSTTSYLDYINIHPDGSVLVGCSELTGRYWNGGAMILSSLDNVKHCKKNIDLTNGSADGCFLWDSKKVILCEDSGAVSIWSTSEDAWSLWTEVVSVAEHDNVALAVDCLDSGKEYVTVGADGNAKVWDINEMLCVRNYSAAHTREICGVSVRPKSTTSFVTGSLDRYITMWDDHTDKPVDLWKNNCGVRCLQWLDENKLLFGDDAGVLSVVDVRNTESVQKLAEFPAPIHRIVIQNGCDKVAVCCDNKIVTVCQTLEDGQQCKVIYSNKDAHSNYVRGAAWDVRDPDVLHTLGWDGEIKAHKINN